MVTKKIVQLLVTIRYIVVSKIEKITAHDNCTILLTLALRENLEIVAFIVYNFYCIVKVGKHCYQNISYFRSHCKDFIITNTMMM